MRQWKSAVPGIQRLTLNCAWASKQSLKNENWWQPTRKLRNLYFYVSLCIQTIQMIKPRSSIRTDLPFRVIGRSRPLDKGWGVGEKRNGLKKNCFQFGLKIRGAGGWLDPPLRVIGFSWMGEISYQQRPPELGNLAFSSRVMLGGFALLAKPTFCISFKRFTMFCIKKNVYEKVASPG